MSVIGPNIVEPDINNFDSIPVGGGCFSGPVEHGGSVYVAATRIAQSTGAAKLAVYKSGDSFTSDRHVLDYSNGPSLDLTNQNGIIHSPSDHRFYLSFSQTSGANQVVCIAAFDIFLETWVLLDSGGPSGPHVNVHNMSLCRLSTGVFQIIYTDLDISNNYIKIVSWSAGTWGSPITVVTTPRTGPVSGVQLTQTPINDVSDQVWIPYLDIGVSPRTVYVIPVTSGGVVGSATTIHAFSNESVTPSGPCWYLSSVDTVVIPFGHTNQSTHIGSINQFVIDHASTAPNDTVVTVATTGSSEDPSNIAFLSNSSETLFTTYLLNLINSDSDEQLEKWSSTSFTSWPNPSSVEWDYNTNPPQAGPFGVPGLETDSCLAPAYLDSETAYGTLLTFFYPICPEVYYMKIGGVPLPTQAIMLSMGESMTDVNFPHMS